MISGAGLFDFIGDIFGGGGGPSGPVGYSSPNVGEYETGAREAIGGRAGAVRRPKRDDKGNIVKGPDGKPQYEYDYSGIKPIGVREAKKPYSFGEYDTATKRLGTYSPFEEQYKSGYARTPYEKTTFNYKGLPQQYGNMAYERGAKDVRREGAGQIQQLRETIGPRRSGLLMKAGEGAQRGTRESLAELSSDIRRDVMDKTTNLAVQQQQDQAAENYRKAGFDEETARYLAGEDFKGYESRALNEARRAEDRRGRDIAGVDAAGRRIGMEREAATTERDYADRAIEWLQNLFQTAGQLTNQAEQAGQSSRDTRHGQTMDFIGSLIP